VCPLEIETIPYYKPIAPPRGMHGSIHYPFTMKRNESIQNGAKSHFHLRNGLLWYKQNRLYVPEGKIRDTLLKECHDGEASGFVATFANSSRAVGKCVNGLHGKFAPFKRV
jgi:hypothetical protein